MNTKKHCPVFLNIGHGTKPLSVYIATLEGNRLGERVSEIVLADFAGEYAPALLHLMPGTAKTATGFFTILRNFKTEITMNTTTPPAAASTRHTPEPWIIDDRHIHPATGLTYPAGVEPETDVIVQVDTDCHAGALLNDTDKANMRRIVACVNFLAGISADKLTPENAARVKELLA